MPQTLTPMVSKGSDKCYNCHSQLEPNEPGVYVSDNNKTAETLCYECATDRVNYIKKMMYSLYVFLVNKRGKQWELNTKLKRDRVVKCANPIKAGGNISIPRRSLQGIGTSKKSS